MQIFIDIFKMAVIEMFPSILMIGFVVFLSYH